MDDKQQATERRLKLLEDHHVSTQKNKGLRPPTIIPVRAEMTVTDLLEYRKYVLMKYCQTLGEAWGDARAYNLLMDDIKKYEEDLPELDALKADMLSEAKINKKTGRKEEADKNKETLNTLQLLENTHKDHLREKMTQESSRQRMNEWQASYWWELLEYVDNEIAKRQGKAVEEKPHGLGQFFKSNKDE